MTINTTFSYTARDMEGEVSHNFNDWHIKEPESQMHTAMTIVGFLAVSGMIGNSLVLYVFSGQRQKPTSTIFILTLALTDLVTSTVTMPYTIVVEMLHFEVEYDIVCKLYQFLITSTIPFSAFVMVAIAVDRYLCIVHPFRHTMTMERAKSTVALLAILAIMLGVLCCLMYGVYKETKTTVQPNCTMVNETYEFYELLNLTSDSMQENGLNCKNETITNIIHTGICQKDHMILGPEFFTVFQKIYSACFGVCAVVVIILYTIIYHSVFTRRRKRLHAAKKWCSCLWDRGSPSSKPHEHTEFIVLNSESYDKETASYSNGNGPTYKDQSIQTERSTMSNTNTNTNNESASNTQNLALLRPRTKARPERLRMANIKTALMLSVVALVYIIAFLPAWLMAFRVIPMNVIVFYLYFTYNVANPVIYAFLNQSFRNHLKTLFCTRKPACVNEVSRITWESALQSSFKS